MGKGVKNANEKKKPKTAILVSLVILLIVVLGATYAFFQISTSNESSNTNIIGSTPDKSLVELKGVTSNLHLNISVSDMSLENANKIYYATDVENKSHEDNEEDGTKTIANVTLKEGDTTTKYSCTAKLTVSKVTEPDTEKDTMVEVLQPGDMILQFKGNIISDELDLSELKTTGSKEYNLKFKVTGSTPEKIQAYIKLINKRTSQNYLSSRKLNININTSDLKCEIFIPDPKIALLRAKDKEVSGGVEHLSPLPNQGGMYRYQGTDDVPNWICFGTTDKNECTNEETGIDKYMYRIIGITEEGQMYLIKETFVKEGSTTNTFAWNSTDSISDCLVGKCEWPNADLYKRLNGEASNGNPIFVNSNEYDYLKSTNSSSDGKASEWYQLIADHNWMYGDTNLMPSDITIYTGDKMYAIETGKADTLHYVQQSDGVIEEQYRWTGKTTGKISLMYIHDYTYSYYDGLTEESRGNPQNSSAAKNGWLFFQKDGYNKFTGEYYEWLSTLWGVYVDDAKFFARHITETGAVQGTSLNSTEGVRPVFYLKSSAKIKDGNGTKGNPYILA